MVADITSMAGTWMAVVEGFGGMRVRNNKLNFDPFLPEKWQSFSFNIIFRGARLAVKVNAEGVEIANQSDHELKVLIYQKEYPLAANKTISAAKKSV